VTLFLDALKGFVPVLLARAWGIHHWGSSGAQAHTAMEQTYLLASTAAFMAIVGHVFPVWLKFRGGKGVATGLGAWIGLAPRGVFAMVIVFVVMVILFRYIS